MILNNINKLRESKGLSKAELLKQSNISIRRLIRLENQENTEISKKILEQFCKIFECGIADLYYYVPDEENKNDSD